MAENFLDNLECETFNYVTQDFDNSSRNEIAHFFLNQPHSPREIFLVLPNVESFV